MEKITFTGEQTRRIDELISSNFENASKDDIELYANWRIWKDRNKAEFEAMCEAHEKEAAERIEIARQQAEKASDALDLLVSKAIERFERISE